MPAPEKTVYGRCCAAPEVSQSETGRVVRFDLVQAETGQALAVIAWPSATAALSEWIADLTAAPLIRVTGRFRLHRPGPVGQRVWQILASAIEIGPRDSGADLIAGPKAYALERASHPEMPAAKRTERTLEVGRAILKPMQRHREGFALAFQAYSRGDALIDVVYPVADDADPGDLVALSGALSRASRITLTGYFRPSVVRGDQVMRWGFVASGHAIEGPRPPKPPPAPAPQGQSPGRRPRTVKPAPPAPEPLPQEIPLLGLSSAEREALAGLSLARAHLQPTLRKALEALGCTTVVDVADLSAGRLERHPGIGRRRVQLCRRAVQDCLIWLSRHRAGPVTPTPAGATDSPSP